MMRSLLPLLYLLGKYSKMGIGVCLILIAAVFMAAKYQSEQIAFAATDRLTEVPLAIDRSYEEPLAFPEAVVIPQPAVTEVQSEKAEAQVSATLKKELSDDQLIAAYAELIMTDNHHMEFELANKIAGYYRAEEKKYDFTPGLLLSIGHRESEHNIHAKSNKDAHGIMQVQIPTAKRFAKDLNLWQEPKIEKVSGKSPQLRKEAEKEHLKKIAQAEKRLKEMVYDPEINIQLGAKTLSAYLKEANGDLDAALERYSGKAVDYAAKVKGFHQEILKSLEGLA